MSGWYKMHRGWMDHEVFADEPASEREAWERLISTAAYRPTTRRGGKGDVIDVARGQLHTSERTLASSWKWDRKRVNRFLKRLEKAEMIGVIAGPSGILITVCNYEEYQQQDDNSGANHGADNGANAGPTRGQRGATQEEGKEIKEGKESTTAAFAGRVIRLNQADYDNWAKTFHAIPDLKAELTGLDAWLDGQSEAKRKGWFHSVAGNLSRKHQEHIAAEKPKPPPVIRAPLRTEAPC